MRDEKEGRKRQARSNKEQGKATQHTQRKVKQTNKAKQHSTPEAVTFPRKNELPRVGLEPTTLYTLDRALYQLSYMYQGSSAARAQISHVHVHVHVQVTPCCNVHVLTWRDQTHPPVDQLCLQDSVSIATRQMQA